MKHLSLKEDNNNWKFGNFLQVLDKPPSYSDGCSKTLFVKICEMRVSPNEMRTTNWQLEKL